MHFKKFFLQRLLMLKLEFNNARKWNLRHTINFSFNSNTKRVKKYKLKCTTIEVLLSYFHFLLPNYKVLHGIKKGHEKLPSKQFPFIVLLCLQYFLHIHNNHKKRSCGICIKIKKHHVSFYFAFFLFFLNVTLCDQRLSLSLSFYIWIAWSL